MTPNITKLKPLVSKLSKDISLLLVDDDPILIEIYKSIFANDFLLCDVATNGKIAYEMWEASPSKYDLIVSDINMPVMTGLELLEKVREKSTEQSFIIVTSSKDIELSQNIAYHQVDAILPKPLNETILFPLLYRVLTKVTDHKDIHLYIEQLEHYSHEHVSYQLGIKRIIKELQHNTIDSTTLIASLENIISPKDDVTTTQTVSNKKEFSTQEENDLRVDIQEKEMSSLELHDILDEYILDKIENLFEIMDSLYLHLDRLYEIKDIILNYTDIQRIANSIDNFATILESIGLFSIITRAFSNLNDALLNLDEENLTNIERNKLFLEMFTYLLNDMKNWIQIVFIDKKAENIYYFDASFVSNCLNISSIFDEHDDDAYDIDNDDDMFF
jgi:CheY-like chemotaxis protein